ncbi:hypothetical protein ABIB66_008474 [Bradyrhizobium sp. F1.13.3]
MRPATLPIKLKSEWLGSTLRSVPVRMALPSFGGWKASRFGDHHVHDPEGVRFYTKRKTNTTRWPTGSAPAANSLCRR